MGYFFMASKFNTVYERKNIYSYDTFNFVQSGIYFLCIFTKIRKCQYKNKRVFCIFSSLAPGTWISFRWFSPSPFHSLAGQSCGREIDEFSYSAFIYRPRLQSHLTGAHFIHDKACWAKICQIWAAKN